MHQQSTSRRDFLRSSTAATIAGAAATSLVVPHVYGAVSEQIKVGLVGCGGRGTGAARQAMNADKGTILWAVGDTFGDRAEKSLKTLSNLKDKIQVPAERIFTGFDAYKSVIDSGVDVVLLCSPPGFRPEHIRYAVEKGKHIFCEKPMAVDAPGVRSIIKSAEEAKQKNLTLVSGYCWRYSWAERETFKRLHDGEIGDLVMAYGTYNTQGLWHHGRQPEWSDMEWQVRNWLYFTWLSGDHLVEQAVHTVDKVGWTFKDQPPLRAIAHGGRQVRTDPMYGNIFDHFEVVYEYPHNVRGMVFTRQQDGCASGVWDYITGTKGACTINGFQPLHVFHNHGSKEAAWKYNGERNDMYQTEHDELFASVRAGKPINDGPRMVNSTMMAIMGRMAAYTGQVITWEQAMNSKEALGPSKLEWGTISVPPVAKPGRTKFV